MSSQALAERPAMAQALAPIQQPGRMAVAEIIGHVAMVQEVMRAVMKPDVHYGTIPGTDKPTLLKSGAEVLCMAFRIADSYEVEDLSTEHTVRYRVTCTGTHQVTGLVLGTGMGEASSGEEKYKWRKASSPQEFEATPPNLRREKHVKPRNGNPFTIQQVRTEPADLANTILKMANKRAKMAMVLNVTAASDCFSQDLEDMDDALRDHLSRRGDDGQSDNGQQQGKQEEKSLPPYDQTKFEHNLKSTWAKRVTDGGKPDDLLAMLKTRNTLTAEQEAAIKALKPATPAAEPWTFERVKQRLEEAKDVDALYIAADLISAVPDETQRAELNTLFDQLNTKMKGQ
jgi:hypothetical protein